MAASNSSSELKAELTKLKGLFDKIESQIISSIDGTGEGGAKITETFSLIDESCDSLVGAGEKTLVKAKAFKELKRLEGLSIDENVNLQEICRKRSLELLEMKSNYEITAEKLRNMNKTHKLATKESDNSSEAMEISSIN